MSAKQCCDQMQEQADWHCDCHARPEDCPDALVAFTDIGQQPYGLWDWEPWQALSEASALRLHLQPRAEGGDVGAEHVVHLP